MFSGEDKMKVGFPVVICRCSTEKILFDVFCSFRRIFLFPSPKSRNTFISKLDGTGQGMFFGIQGFYDEMNSAYDNRTYINVRYLCVGNIIFSFFPLLLLLLFCVLFLFSSDPST